MRQTREHSAKWRKGRQGGDTLGPKKPQGGEGLGFSFCLTIPKGGLQEQATWECQEAQTKYKSLFSSAKESGKRQPSKTENS